MSLAPHFQGFQISLYHLIIYILGEAVITFITGSKRWNIRTFDIVQGCQMEKVQYMRLNIVRTQNQVTNDSSIGRRFYTKSII